MLLDCRREKRVLGLIGSGSWVSTDRHSHLPSGLPGCRGCCSCVSAQPSWQGWVFSSTLPPALLVSKLVFSLRLFAVIFWSNLTNVYVTENDALRSLKGKKKKLSLTSRTVPVDLPQVQLHHKVSWLDNDLHFGTGLLPHTYVNQTYLHTHTYKRNWFFFSPPINISMSLCTLISAECMYRGTFCENGIRTFMC